MPRSPRKERMKAARDKLSPHSLGGKKNPSLIPESSPLKAIAAPGEKRNRVQVIPYDMDESLREQRTLKRSREEDMVDSNFAPRKRQRVTSSKRQKDIDEIQRKWAAVADVLSTGEARLGNDRWDAIAEKHGVGSGSNLRKLCVRARKTGDLARAPGQGAKKTVFDEVSTAMKEIANTFSYSFTAEVMALKVKEKIGGKGSKQTVQRVLAGWKRVRQSVLPFLTPDHMRSRLEWARKFKGFNYDNDKIVRIHIDEKCFYAFSARGRILYLPPGVEPPQFYALSKTQIPWVSFPFFLPLFPFSSLFPIFLFFRKSALNFSFAGDVLGRCGQPYPQTQVQRQDWTLVCGRGVHRLAQEQVPREGRGVSQALYYGWRVLLRDDRDQAHPRHQTADHLEVQGHCATRQCRWARYQLQFGPSQRALPLDQL